MYCTGLARQSNDVWGFLRGVGNGIVLPPTPASNVLTVTQQQQQQQQQSYPSLYGGCDPQLNTNA